jgi:DNA-binding GntR family transcriptional regulator
MNQSEAIKILRDVVEHIAMGKAWNTQDEMVKMAEEALAATENISPTDADLREMFEKEFRVDLLERSGNNYTTTLRTYQWYGWRAAWKQFASKVEEWRKQNAAYRDVLKKCAKQFRFYETNHVAKNKMDKAATNATFAIMCEEALNQGEKGGSDE